VNRRGFITLLGGAAVWPVAARAQQRERVRTIGILASQPLPPIQRFARKLRDYGYIEGQSSATSRVQAPILQGSRISSLKLAASGWRYSRRPHPP
jgi:hypothetical protein